MNRVPFANMKDFIPLPNLIGHQLDSFKEFIDKGIGEVLEQVFPIKDKEVDGVYEFQQLGYYVEPPTVTPKEVKQKNGTYTGKLKVRTRLINKTFGEIKESDVFFCEVPYMTDNGKFIVNGVDRIVVTQITKAPGAFFNKSISDKGKTLYTAKIQPDRGTYIAYETDNKDIAHVRIDQTHKMPLTVFLKALGLGTNDDLIELFGSNKYILATLEKDKTETYEEALIEFFRKARPNEVPTVERSKSFIQSAFFDPKRYDLERTGRFKMNQKLNLAQRTLKKPLAKKVGKYEAGHFVDDEVLSETTDNVIFVENKNGEEIKVIGNKVPETRCLTLDDIIASVSYFLNLDSGIGDVDDIDHLSNRTIKLVGRSLQKEFLAGLRRAERNMREQLLLNASNSKKELDELTPQNLIYTKQIESKFREFLGSSQLSQYADQINPLGELSNIRRTTAIGPGGFSKERAGVEVRDVNSTHYGRLCPIETPEGQSVGLINQLSSFSHINEFGFITSPYRKVNKKKAKASDEIKYLTADIEEKYYIAESSAVDDDGNFKSDYVGVRYGKEYLTVHKEEVDYVAVSSKQPFGVGAVCIPFLENDDANRALMGANMQRQGVPTINPKAPLVATGIEGRIAKDTKASIISDVEGTIRSITPDYIEVCDENGEIIKHTLNKFMRTNDGTCWNHFVRCHVGQKIKPGDVLADSTSSDQGELAVGQNLLVAFVPMEGYNYEDSIVLSERLVNEDVLTVIMLNEYKAEVRTTRLGSEEITWDIPQTNDAQKKNLDDEGIVKIGTFVNGGDILVGKRTPKAKDEKKAEERLLDAIYIGKSDDYRDNSTYLPAKKKGIVVDIIRNTMKNGSELKKGVKEEVKVVIAEIRKISVGDKMAGRHGNKGVISSIRPVEDMPHLADGTPVDICLNPLGVPSRMNIGQVMELHLGMIARELGVNFETPVFGGIDSKKEIQHLLKENGLPENGKFQLYDGRTGEPLDNPVSVGVMYFLKLNHQVEDKVHARSTGPYSLVTQQPLGGKAQNGGQRFGEMEVWALEGYGAAYTLQELMTLKSDDYRGRQKLYTSQIKGFELPKPNLTESLKLLLSEIKAIGLDVDIVTDDGEMLLKPKYKPEQIVLESDEDRMEFDFITEVLSEDNLDDVESLDETTIVKGPDEEKV